MKKYVDMAYKIGFTNAAEFDPKTVSFHDAPILRSACEANDCGHYGKFWTCPPGIGSVKKREDFFHSYDHGLIMQLITESVSAVLQPELFGEVSRSCNLMGQAIKKAMKEEFQDIYMIGMSGCTLCDECSYPTEPCRHPDEVITCMSGNAINVYRLWDSTGFPRPKLLDSTDLYIILLAK